MQHDHCMPWCERDHDPRNACYAELSTVESAEGEETTIGLYGTAAGVFLAVGGRAIPRSTANMLMLAYQANLPVMTQYERQRQAAAGGSVPDHMPWCSSPDHHEIACRREVLYDSMTSVAIEGSPDQEIGLAFGPVYRGEPTPVYIPDTSWGAAPGAVQAVEPGTDRAAFLGLAELAVLAQAYASAGSMLNGPGRQDPDDPG